MSLKVEWKCPKCGAKANKHGKGGQDQCVSRGRACDGFICECDDPGSILPDHGASYSTPCYGAKCYHCEWGGTFPLPPAKWPKWTKEAAKAGWTPPEGWQP